MLLAMLGLLSASPIVVVKGMTQTEEEAPKGKIVMFRPLGLTGAAVACPIRYQRHELVELGRGKWAEWIVKPGRYILANKTHSVEVNVDAGETRFVRCNMQMGTWTFNAALQIVDEYTWNEHAADYKQKTISEPTSQ